MSQLKLAMVPVSAVRYCRQSWVGDISDPHSNCLVVVVVPTSTLIVITLQRDEAGTNMCCPVLVPQMMGGEEPPGLLTVKVSVAQSPTRGPSDMAAAVNTGVVIPSGAARTMV